MEGRENNTVSIKIQTIQMALRITDMDNSILNIALAEDDEDDRMLFKEVLEEIDVRIHRP